MRGGNKWTFIKTLSFNGFKSFTSSVSRIPTMSSSFNMRWFVPLNSTSVPAYLEYTIWAPVYMWIRELNSHVKVTVYTYILKVDRSITFKLMSTLTLPTLRPSPTATTSPPWGLVWAVVGNRMPPTVFSSGALILTSTLSPKGFSAVYYKSKRSRQGVKRIDNAHPELNPKLIMHHVHSNKNKRHVKD